MKQDWHENSSFLRARKDRVSDGMRKRGAVSGKIPVKLDERTEIYIPESRIDEIPEIKRTYEERNKPYVRGSIKYLKK